MKASLLPGNSRRSRRPLPGEPFHRRVQRSKKFSERTLPENLVAPRRYSRSILQFGDVTAAQWAGDVVLNVHVILWVKSGARTAPQLFRSAWVSVLELENACGAAAADG